MNATTHLLCGPSGSGKTGRLLERYLAVARTGVGTALWLGPTGRDVAEVRERLARSGAPVLAPHLYAFHDFAAEVVRANDPRAAPLSNAQRRLLAEDLVAALHARGQLTHFQRVIDTRGFAEGLFAFLAELKRQGISPAAFARAAYRRGYGGPHAARTIKGQAISRKDRQGAKVYARYQSLLTRHRLVDPEGRYADALDLLRRGARQPFAAARAVFVDGFADLTRVQVEILAALAGWVEEVWVALPDEPGDERAELFTRSRRTRQRLDVLQPHVTLLSEPLAGAAGSLDASRSCGLAHLERQLFRPYRQVVQAPDATGVSCIEAPGLLGEARLVARRVKALLLDGVSADEVLVVVRDLSPYADLLHEVFTEYGIPHDLEGTEPLLNVPAVATLLRAARLPEEDWPFAAVTALLRSGYFRPDWEETQAATEMPLRAEALLRLLGEPRGREAYLLAVRKCIEDPHPPLEDESAEESRRRRTYNLAVQCRPFLERFFATWDNAPRQAPLRAHVAWLRQIADDLGIPRAAGDGTRDAAALGRFFEELAHWERLEARLHGGQRSLSRKVFLHRLGTLAAEAGIARTPRGPGRVRVLSAEMARSLSAEHVFVLGLGERGFPRLTAPEPFFDEAERQSFNLAGLDFACLDDLLPDEMLLFYQVATRARRGLTLSYPAVDGKGQALLPSSFLGAALECFTPGAVPVERRNLLIERYDRDAPLSPAEYRVRLASAAAPGTLHRYGLPPDLAANLEAAAELHFLRFRLREFGAYDGLLRDPAVLADLAERFGPQRVFSPTALEDYVACPFRFFLGHVLYLEPLEDPKEEIEVTRRGAAFHRALSRLHAERKAAGAHHPEPGVEGDLARHLDLAVAEYVERAPSPASKVLWRLEGRRLRRRAADYVAHWKEFVKPWLPLAAVPRPVLFEADFGLPPADGKEPHPPLVLRTGDVEVRVSGRIDRVDVAELPGGGLGFWVIDYKTGRSSNYTATDLKEFRKLQLTLYALAVEEVLLQGRDARPLGLAYWLVTDDGAKVVLPGKDVATWLNESERWRALREQLQAWVTAQVRHIRGGGFPLKPRSETCTQTCDFAQVCRIAQSRSVDKPWELLLPPGP